MRILVMLLLDILYIACAITSICWLASLVLLIPYLSLQIFCMTLVIMYGVLALTVGAGYIFFIVADKLL